VWRCVRSDAHSRGEVDEGMDVRSEEAKAEGDCRRARPVPVQYHTHTYPPHE
jgi:hypothetical protein